VNNATGQETFMKMLEVRAGLGIGVKKFHVAFVFSTIPRPLTLSSTPDGSLALRPLPQPSTRTKEKRSPVPFPRHLRCGSTN